MGLRIGFIGVGAIGAPIASRLLACGHQVRAFDIREQAVRQIADEGADPMRSAADAADGADLVMTCLPSPAALADALCGDAGVLTAARPAPVVADLSTCGPKTAADLAARLLQVGVEYVDAPVSGGPGRARAGELAVMCAGAEQALATARPALRALGDPLFVVGSAAGQAQIVKLINNVLSYAALAASSEALVVGARAGIDPAAALRALNAGTGRNSATTSKIPDHVLTRRFDYGAANRISQKDLSLFCELAGELHADTPIARLLLDLLEAWLPSREDEDMTSIARRFEAAAGIELRTGAPLRRAS
jgi:2-hydroxy-3-oxopropionate reductase